MYFGGQSLKEISKCPLVVTRTSRFKAEGEEDLAKTVSNLKKRGILFLVYRGGNDGAQKALQFYEYEKKENILVAHLPKTIDNDILHIDICPGFPSAAKSAILDTLMLTGDTYAFGVPKSYMNSLPEKVEKEAIFTGVVAQGRDAGHLAAATVIARPDLIYISEVPITIDGLVNDIQKVIYEKGSCTAVFSEGVRLKEGDYLASYVQVGAPLLGIPTKELTREDAHKNKSVSDCRLPLLLKMIVEEHVKPPRWAKSVKGRTGTLGYKTRMDTFAISSLDAKQEYELAEMVLEEFLKGDSGFMVTNIREQDRPYEYRIGTVPSNQVADTSKESKQMIRQLDTDRFLTPEKNNVKVEEMLKYLGPFLEDIPQILKGWTVPLLE